MDLSHPQLRSSRNVTNWATYQWGKFNPHDPSRTRYDIFSTCFSTVVICVWSALHMNIPTRDRRSMKTRLVKGGWVALGLLMPDLLLLIAVCELASAVILLRKAYKHLPDLPSPPEGWLYRRVLLRGIAFEDSDQVSISRITLWHLSLWTTIGGRIPLQRLRCPYVT